MNFGFNIGIYNLSENQKIEDFIIEIMVDQGFHFIDSDQTRQALQISDAVLYYHQIDDKLMLRKFYIAPNRNKWIMIYPSTGWFTETQALSIELSNKLNCVTIALLVDDSNGWGYELSRKGQVIDRFHTDPLNSSVLLEKSEEGITQPKIEVEDYRGNPSLLVNLFGVDREQVVYSLKNLDDIPDRWPQYEMDTFFKVLDIPGGQDTYEQVRENLEENNQGWAHLVFARHLTDTELQWRQKWLPDFPYLLPPLWLEERQKK